jgi:hypothetical protein
MHAASEKNITVLPTQRTGYLQDFPLKKADCLSSKDVSAFLNTSPAR